MTKFAVVTEGPTDFIILRAVLQKIRPGVDVVPWHPAVPVAAYPEYNAVVGGQDLGAGWRGVKQWCEEYGEDLELLMGAVTTDRYECVIIHVDASIADKLGVEKPCPPASATTDGLRETVLNEWLHRAPVPAFLVLATPSKSTESWAVAAVAPGYVNVECDLAVERELVRRRYVSTRNGKVRRERKRYESLAIRVGREWENVRAACEEAERFNSDVEALAAIDPPNGQN